MRPSWQRDSGWLAWVAMLSLVGCGSTERDSSAPPQVEAPGPGWTAVAPLPEERWDFATTTLDCEIFVLGGVTPNEPTSSTVFAYAPARGTWRQLASMPQPLRSAN